MYPKQICLILGVYYIGARL